MVMMHRSSATPTIISAQDWLELAPGASVIDLSVWEMGVKRVILTVFAPYDGHAGNLADLDP